MKGTLAGTLGVKSHVLTVTRGRRGNQMPISLIIVIVMTVVVAFLAGTAFVKYVAPVNGPNGKYAFDLKKVRTRTSSFVSITLPLICSFYLMILAIATIQSFDDKSAEPEPKRLLENLQKIGTESP